MKVIDFLKLHGGEPDECVELYECDDREAITVPVAEVLENAEGRYTEVLNGELASLDYDDCTICLYYFREEK